MRILLVEDDLEISKMLRDYLTVEVLRWYVPRTGKKINPSFAAAITILCCWI